MTKCMRHGKLCGHRRQLTGHYSICNYYLNTGQLRGCPAGAKCTHYTTEKIPELKEAINDETESCP